MRGSTRRSGYEGRRAMMTDSRVATLKDAPLAPVTPKGRSLWQDAGHRFVANRAAMISVIILALIVLFTIVGPLVAKWPIEKIDWTVVGKVITKGAPSIATGHYFGTDDVGRDLYSRVIQGTMISLAVG